MAFIPIFSSNSSQGTWGDFGFTPDNNPYWQNGGTVTAGSLFTKGTSSWYPASGLRYSNSGILSNVATAGCSWSASSCNDSSNARRVHFYASIVYPTSDHNRSHGFPVRCVQE